MNTAAGVDHRQIGEKLNLFTIDQEVGQGVILWKPKGAKIRSILEDTIKNDLQSQGYRFVYTPHVGKVDLYRQSGHYPYFQDSQFPPVSMEDGEQYLLKPMNCPHHIKIYSSDFYSYRDLPVRLAEFGTVYRFEQSGELSGLTRTRGFTQDDAHIFCIEDQVSEEIDGVINSIVEFLQMFDFSVKIRLSLSGSKEHQRAEEELTSILENNKVEYFSEEGEAAFYGPKIDFIVQDSLERDWQLGTVQLDYYLPKQFDISYVGHDNDRHHPVMIHRAILGSFERFVGILLEHYEGDLPFWIAPEQIRIIPTNDQCVDYAKKIDGILTDFRTEIDYRDDGVGKKIARAENQRIPFMLIVGNKEERNNTVSVRQRGKGDLGEKTIRELFDLAP